MNPRIGIALAAIMVIVAIVLLCAFPQNNKTAPVGTEIITSPYGVRCVAACVSSPDSRFPRVIEVNATKRSAHFRIKFRIWAQDHYDSLITAIADTTLLHGYQTIPEGLVTWMTTNNK